MFEVGIYSAIAPFVLLLLSSVWQYPAVLEEVMKWGIIHWSLVTGQWSMKNGVIVGLVFGFSEAVLFSMNAWNGGQWGVMGMRLLLTVPMHTVTASVTAWGVNRKRGWVGLVIAMGIHAGFNYWVGR